jgi:deoxyribodipyrimidine photo-lyase
MAPVPGVMDTALVWFRRDLRVHDHPPLRAALDACERVVPVFVLDDRLLGGRFASGSRTRFLLECLHDLRDALDGNLVVVRGAPEKALPALAREHGATAAYFAADHSPFARRRDEDVEAALREAGVEPRRTPGNFIAGVEKPYVVFSPFWRAWQQVPRRAVLGAPGQVPVPDELRAGRIPSLAELGLRAEVPDPLPGGERAGRTRMLAWDHTTYAHTRDRLDRETSMLSPYLHFGCVSARELEERTGGEYARQLAWRDFYAHVLLHNPGNIRHAFRPEPEWDGEDEHFDAWREGRTGFPVVDAGMRQLAATGWMHNRARLIVACFLVKDLHIDWRRGEQHFMRHLLDGDVANNNGNWQWISSVGVDPAPLHRRLYNPERQQRRHDPEGEYVRRWVPQEGPQPEPIVDHASERERALAAYRAVR